MIACRPLSVFCNPIGCRSHHLSFRRLLSKQSVASSTEGTFRKFCEKPFATIQTPYERWIRRSCSSRIAAETTHHSFFIHHIPAARTRCTSGKSPWHGNTPNGDYHRSICNYVIVVRTALEIAARNTLERSKRLGIFGFLGGSPFF